MFFFNWQNLLKEKRRKKNAQFIKTESEKLINVIPQLKKIEVGLNHPEAPQNNYDIATYSGFSFPNFVKNDLKANTNRLLRIFQ